MKSYNILELPDSLLQHALAEVLEDLNYECFVFKPMNCNSELETCLYGICILFDIHFDEYGEIIETRL